MSCKFAAMDALFTDDFFMKQALKEAEYAFEEGEIPVGAVIVANNQIIARGHNQTERLQDVTAHAEMIAITAASHYLDSKYLKNCTLYVTLEPCAMCAGALYWTQISRVVFAAHDPKRGFQQSGVALHPKTQLTTGVMAGVSEQILLHFFQSKR